MMDNKEKNNIPDISFKPIEDRDNGVIEENSVPKDTDVNSDNESAEEIISRHKASLDRLFDEMNMEKELEEEQAKAKIAEEQASQKEEASESEQNSSEKEAAPLEFHNDYDDVPKKKKKKKGKKKKKKLRFNTSIIGGLTITVVIVAMSVVFATGAITLGMEYLGINKSDNEITFNIPKGSNNDEIADILIENQIIKNKKLFKVALKIQKPDALYPGDISLSPNLSYPDIIEKLSVMRESYETATVTIPKGATLLEVSKLLEKNGICSAEDFLFQFNADQDFDIDKTINHSDDVYYTMEGYFFPDTYEFYVNDTAYNVTKIVREHFSEKITDDMYKRMNELGMDLNEVITLASIVQWEAASEEEMPTVASVFINRLNDPDTFPSLQSDATKSYIKKVIKKVESSSAMIDHYTNCYDTYTCIGLPAGPICNPGLDAINAVLYPEDTEYYYFCNNLETGKSYYAKTYKQHQKNLKKAGLSE
jgi:UPF0755 protein